MAATNEHDQFRVDLENAMGPLALLDEHLRVAQIKLAQWARTDYEADIIREMIAARQQAAKVRKQLAEMHPNGRGRKK